MIGSLAVLALFLAASTGALLVSRGPWLRRAVGALLVLAASAWLAAAAHACAAQELGAFRGSIDYCAPGVALLVGPSMLLR